MLALAAWAAAVARVTAFVASPAAGDGVPYCPVSLAGIDGVATYYNANGGGGFQTSLRGASISPTQSKSNFRPIPVVTPSAQVMQA